MLSAVRLLSNNYLQYKYMPPVDSRRFCLKEFYQCLNIEMYKSLYLYCINEKKELYI